MRTSTSNVKTVPAALRVQLNGPVMAAWVGDEVIRGVRGRMRSLVTRKRMDVLLVCMHLERHEVEKLSRLLQCRDAVVWVHIPVCNWQAVNVLSGVFDIHADRG